MVQARANTDLILFQLIIPDPLIPRFHNLPPFSSTAHSPALSLPAPGPLLSHTKLNYVQSLVQDITLSRQIQLFENTASPLLLVWPG